MADVREVYERRLRPELPLPSRDFWDRRIDYFSGREPRKSFYFHGTSGAFAWMVNRYIDRVAKLRSSVEAMLDAQSLEEQRQLYGNMRNRIWNGVIRWLVGRDATLALLGVPRPQRLQVDRDYHGGIAYFIEDCVETVFGQLPIRDNYFCGVYLTGRYTRDCCPEYLRPEQFARLKGGLVERLSTHTMSVCDFVRQTSTPISKFVLLDHMDWLSYADLPLLARQWQLIADRAARGARLLWRSAGTRCDHIDELRIRRGRGDLRLGDCLNYDRPLAARLHVEDRVHTYGSFHIADLAA